MKEDNPQKGFWKERVVPSLVSIINIIGYICETFFSAIAFVLLYIIYIPFGIGRALIDINAIRKFYSDVLFVLEAISTLDKRKEGRK